ncbi:MAG: ABC transporter substrate-binding protein [Bdellovibrionales bacterium]|jgi:branched-chain amino acid transport system substrate-binding protein|nr:ABC transporter substrate-binding protein [Bdellovibrionales bacterium]MBT3525023.1 ABC transporter substrate-binding protein [Bdellovibrionales bacterium]MBT7767563.1 ABC transporter substrate-binding protein [Bdellovibrionales bacterium]
MIRVLKVVDRVRGTLLLFFCIIGLLFVTPLLAINKSSSHLRIYLDADLTGSKESGRSIEYGIRTALAEVGNVIAGRSVQLVILDHKGNSSRSRSNLERFNSDPNALLVFGGLHSPPLLRNRKFINQHGILTLVPWAAAGPITRGDQSPNWIFRLSIDDAKASAVLVNYAIQKRKFKRPVLLLERTGWGRNNYNNMLKRFKQLGLPSPLVRWFDWSVSGLEVEKILQQVQDYRGDVIIFVGNAPEGKTIFKIVSQIPSKQRPAIVSHWGITGGDFPQVIGATMRSKLDLHFLQTNFSFLNENLSPFAKDVFSKLQALYPKIKGVEDLKAPAGFIHAYDLTKILITAIRASKLSSNIVKARNQLRKSLENITFPVKGLLKTYHRPFTPFTSDKPDAHEALRGEDFVMAHYNQRNAILLDE